MIEIEADDNIWPIYNEQLKTLCEKNIKLKTNQNVTRIFYLKYLASTLNNIGYLFNMQGNTMKALIFFKKSLLLQEEIKDQKGIAESLNNIGVIYQNQSDIPRALECYHRSLRIQENIKDKSGIASSLNNIGAIYQNQNEHTKALDFFTKSLKLQEEVNDLIGLAYTLNNIGRIYDAKYDFQKALEYHYRSLAVRKKINDKGGIANSLNNIGAIFHKQAEKNNVNKDSLLQKALEYHQASLKEQREIEDKKGVAYSLNSIAAAQFQLNQINLAEQNAMSSLKLAQELGYPLSITNASMLLSKIYFKGAKYKKAYEMQVLYKQMEDSLNNESNRKAGIQKSLQYVYEKKTVADSMRVTEERKIFVVKIKQEKTLRLALYAGITLIGIFSIFMFSRFRVTRKQRDIIELQKKEVDNQRQLADDRRIIAEQQKQIIEEKQKEILDSIHYAKRIQQAMLTSESYITEHLQAEYFIFYQPKDIVSGDFYWALAHNEMFYLATADCTGHGVPGAFMSLLNISFLNENVIERKLQNPDQILNEQRREIIKALNPNGTENSKDGMDCILCAYDLQNMRLNFATANHSLWLIRDKTLTSFKGDKMPVGKYHENVKDFTLQSIELKKGDLIYTFTDGCVDQFGGPKGKKFMYKKLEQLLIENHHLPMEAQKENIDNALNEWRGEMEQLDDVTIIGIRI
ncbi:MAG: tetratricopeptide repeat protein [Burkholderiales bacterium]|nr:tetratricopeptide repeat protein [Bacteroidia bacterium]